MFKIFTFRCSAYKIIVRAYLARVQMCCSTHHMARNMYTLQIYWDLFGHLGINGLFAQQSIIILIGFQFSLNKG